MKERPYMGPILTAAMIVVPLVLNWVLYWWLTSRR